MSDIKHDSDCKHEHVIYQAVPRTSFLRSLFGLYPDIVIVEICQDCGAFRRVRHPGKIASKITSKITRR